MSKPFKLNNVALYAKGWYKRGGNIWEDLKKCLSADGYSGELFNKYDVMSVILIAFEELPRRYYHGYREFIDGISPQRCWVRGYYYKDKSEEYDSQEAVVRYCLSCFAETDNTDLPLTAPDYDNCLPPSREDTRERVAEVFGSK